VGDGGRISSTSEDNLVARSSLGAPPGKTTTRRREKSQGQQQTAWPDNLQEFDCALPIKSSQILYTVLALFFFHHLNGLLVPGRIACWGQFSSHELFSFRGIRDPETLHSHHV
jgi:hypothetical protein